MPIEINGLPNPQTPVTSDRNGVPTSDREPVGSSRENGRSSLQDTVSFSDTAVRMGQLGVAVDDTPVVDVQRVEKVRQDLTDGTYTVDPTRIAEKLMEFDIALASGG